ncbi:MAG: hypothetical protein N2314_00940 [Brevinematales bacterium]|nr:hypothetical protein [Brevinematales bacterium]
MRRILLGMVCLSLGSMVYAEGIKLGGWVGYTTVSMAKVNEEFQKMADDFKSLGYEVTLNKLGGGLTFGGTIGFGILPNLTAGIKVGYLSCFPLVYKSSYDAGGGDGAEINTKLSPSLLPLMVGITYNIPIGEAFSLGLEGYGGYALAFASLEQSMKMTFLGNTTSDSAIVPLEGNGIVFEIGANGEYKLSSALSLGVGASYRIAEVKEMKASKDVTSEQGAQVVTKGEVLKDSNGNALPFEYSGFNLAVTLNFTL